VVKVSNKLTSGTNTYGRYEMRIHSRIVDIKCPPQSVSEITNFKIKPGVDINIKIWG
jgi:ribosomal protein S10